MNLKPRFSLLSRNLLIGADTRCRAKSHSWSWDY